MDEHHLDGGYVNPVVRVGDTVRRQVGEGSGFVHALLLLLEERGYSAAPRFLGTDEHGREVLTFVEGAVPRDRADVPEVRHEETLALVARLVREFHDLTAGTALAGGAEVVCHNDLSPKNTVYAADARS